MAGPLRVLIVEDLDDDALLLIRCLEKGGYSIVHRRVDNAQHLIAALREKDWDLVLSDYNMPAFSGLEALNIVSCEHPDLPFIIVSGAIGEELAVSLVKAGAADYVMKHNLERLPTAVERALREAVDRSKYQQAQLQIKHSERKFRDLFEGAADAIFFYDLHGRILETNHVASERTGLERTGLLDSNMRQIMSAQDALDFDSCIAAVQQQGGWVHESCLRSSDGALIPVEVNSRLMEYMGEPAVLSLLRDISERKLAAERLKQALQQAEEARDNIDAILRSVIDGLIVVDRDRRIVMLNRKAEELLRVEQEHVAGRRIDESIAQKALVNEVVSVLEGKDVAGVIEWEGAIPGCKDLQIIQAGISLVKNQKGADAGVIAILRDITRERELDRMKSEFVTAAAHELSTPLATIMGFAEILIKQQDLSPQVRHDSLQYIFEKAEDLGRIVDELLNVSRIEFGLQHKLARKACILNDVFDSMITLFRNKYPNRQLDVSLPAEPISLVCDQGRVAHVMENLLSNAVKFSRKDKTVRIAVAERGNGYRFSVKDQGMGMTPEQIERAFDQFYRGNSTDTAIGGMGLGLCIADSIVKAHGGEICIVSAVDKGTEVSFEIPKQ
ncbi:MAG: PAS domain S-box protein [Desulfuromonadales bacterium]|nr:PAS domain S-box protein [Desulfuromonadales bacterium]